MEAAIREAIGVVAGMPPLLLYLILGAGAALENVVPPVPADTFVLLGAFLAGAGDARVALVLLVTWLANVASALAVYGLALRHGGRFLATPVGRWLLRPRQIERLGVFYERWGSAAIFFSRFLPGLRALVPVFAGVSGLHFWRVAPPLAAASLIWYGGLVLFGSAAGRNWESILESFERVSDVLLWAGVAALSGMLAWWAYSRRDRR